MSYDIEIHRASVEPFVVEGELLDPPVQHALCGDRHQVIAGEMRCCCGDTHSADSFICCGCGHHHDTDRGCLPVGPCGSYLCCVN